jgi:hypothetical protein
MTSAIVITLDHLADCGCKGTARFDTTTSSLTSEMTPCGIHRATDDFDVVMQLAARAGKVLANSAPAVSC